MHSPDILPIGIVLLAAHIQGLAPRMIARITTWATIDNEMLTQNISQDEVCQSETLAIDPRSFHVFATDGRFFLFDRATATISELSEFAWKLLNAIEQGASTDFAIRHFSDGDDSLEQLFFSSLQALKSKGFFTYIPVDLEEQDTMIQRLWHHRPRRIQLLMAQGCNLGCRYCYAWRNGSNQLETLMPYNIAKKAVDYLVSKSGTRTDLQVTFFGGEPLLNWEVLQRVVEYCESLERQTGKTFTFEVITNATLLDAEKARYLAEKKFLLMVSIDGWEEMHNYNRPAIGGANRYAEIVENAQVANSIYKSLGLRPIKVRANLTHKYHDHYETVRQLQSLGFERVAVAPIEPLPHSSPSPSSLTEDDCDENLAVHRLRDFAVLKKINSGELLSDEEEELISGYPQERLPLALKGITCGTGRNTQCIDTKGNIYPCHRYEGMEAFIIGNIFEGHNEEKTMRYYRMVNGNATSRCHSCWIRDYCAGGCAWLLSTSTGVLVDPTVRECNRRRTGFQHALFMRSELRKLRPGMFANAAVQINEWDFSQPSVATGGCTSCTSCGS